MRSKAFRVGYPVLFSTGLVLALCATAWVQSAESLEYSRRASTLAEHQAGARVEFALWCAERQLHTEAAGQLALSRIIQPGRADLVEAWGKVTATIPETEAVMTVAMRDGTTVNGVGRIRALLLDTGAGPALVRIQHLATVEEAPGEGGKRVYTCRSSAGAMTTASLLAPAQFEMTTKWGPVKVPTGDLRSLKIERLVPVQDGADSDAGVPAQQMKACFETASTARDPYALYGAAEYFVLTPGRPEEVRAAAAIRDGAAESLRREQEGMDPARRGEPVVADRIVLKSGSQVVGTIRGRSATVVLIEQLTPAGGRLTSVPTDDIAHIDKTHIPPETISRGLLAETCKEFVTAVRGRAPLDVLTAWGKLRHDFPDGKWSDTLEQLLRKDDADASIQNAVAEAVRWAAATCPQCGGSAVEPCKVCEAKGRTVTKKICADCGAAPPERCQTCGGSGFRVCPKCGGAGRTSTGSVGPFRGAAEICTRCNGGKRVSCRDCTNGRILCKRCSGRGSITVLEPCAACKCAGKVNCARCQGTGKWTPAVVKPGEEPPVGPMQMLYRVKAETLGRQQTRERITLAEWCLDRKLKREAHDQLVLAGRLCCEPETLLPAWRCYIDRSTWEDVALTVTVEGGDVIAGKCALKPILLCHPRGIEAVSLREITGFQLLERTEDAIVVAVSTTRGDFEGRLVSFPMTVISPLGKFEFTLDKIRNYQIKSGEAHEAVAVGPGAPADPGSPLPGTPPTMITAPATVDLNWDKQVATLRESGLDVVFVFDATGSMGGVILQVKQNIRGLAAVVAKLVPDTRFGLVAYRDLKKYDLDDYQWTVKHAPLVSPDDEGMLKLQMFLRQVEAYGGGDIPEAVHEGIQTAIEKAGWRPNTRKIIIVFGDAPPRPENNGIKRLYEVCRAWHEKTGGIISCIDTTGSARILPEFEGIARAGGGESAMLRAETALPRQLAIHIFGTQWTTRVDEALKAP